MRRAVIPVCLLAILTPPLPVVAGSPSVPHRMRDELGAAVPVMDRPPVSFDDCRTPGEIAAGGDRDGVRLAGPLADAQLCVGTIEVDGEIGRWTLLVVTHRTRRGPRWVVPHDDEQSALAAGVDAVRRYGGVLVAVEAGEARYWRGVDPNRIFGEGVCGKARADGPYTAAMLAGLDRRFPVVALHSNESRGGTISMARPYAGANAFRGDPDAVPRATMPRRNDDTMLILAGTATPGEAAATARIDWFTRRGVNVLYETVRRDRNDCSLSNYLALTGRGSSFTIEVAHGDTASAIAMVDLVMQNVGVSAR